MMSRWVLSSLFFLYVSSASGKWELEKDESGIKIYSRSHATSDFKEYKALTTFRASRNKVASLILNIDDYVNWFPDCLESYQIKKEGDEMIVYYLIDSPWPISDRDAVMRLKIDHSNKETLIHFEEVTAVKPKVKNVVRIPKSRGFWRLTDVGEKTSVVYQNHADPGGEVPAWVTNLFIVDAPYETLVAMKKRLK
ncbi:MAG: START domain-containing protein [Crocinitomicaceae bacterium]